MSPHISLSAETLTYVMGLPITNSLLTTWLVMLLLILMTYFVTRKITLIPGRMQSVVEILIDGLYSLFASIVGKDNIRQFFPILGSIFIFVLFANWSGLIPGVGTIGFFHESETKHAFIQSANASEVIAQEEHVEEAVETELLEGEAVLETEHETATEEVAKAEHGGFTPLFRGPTADLNTTLALAIVAVVSFQYFGLKQLGFGYVHKFLNFSNPIYFFLGLLEIVSEFAKIISFAFRLFGNVFAGEVLLTVIAFLMPIIAPLPFLGLELFVGMIQALVFSMLSAVFLNTAVSMHGESEHAAH
ncbi:ATP synthase F0 subunit A [Candidatus Microgenomates bacterium]|nr:MAG: ATP synthase F0 subunit A [Candidatus Microgenomates bacterium]